MTHKQLPTCDRALNTRAQARRFLFRRVIEYELTLEHDIADNGRLRIAQRVYSLNENKSSSIATATAVLRKISLRTILLPAALCVSLFSFFLFFLAFCLYSTTRSSSRGNRGWKHHGSL